MQTPTRNTLGTQRMCLGGMAAAQPQQASPRHLRMRPHHMWKLIHHRNHLHHIYHVQHGPRHTIAVDSCCRIQRASDHACMATYYAGTITSTAQHITALHTHIYAPWRLFSLVPLFPCPAARHIAHSSSIVRMPALQSECQHFDRKLRRPQVLYRCTPYYYHHFILYIQ